MAWERRSGGRWFYYRARRFGRRVVKEYLGGVGVGEHAEEADAQARLARDEARQEGSRIVEPLDTCARSLEALEALSNAMAIAALEAAGYHRHHCGEWRKRRAPAKQQG